MNVILTKQMPKLGSKGDIVTVKDGYARNFLLPYGHAIFASKSALKEIAEAKRVEELKLGKDKRIAERTAAALVKISITAKVQVGEEDKLFGAVTTQDIADLLKESGFEIDRRKIQLDEPIKSLGVYQVKIKIHTEVTATVKLWVIKE